MISSLPIKIIKMSGAGNTFAIIDACSNDSWVASEKRLSISRTEFAKKICDKVIGISTDGFLLIEKGSEGFDYNWDFYNSDGSYAEMCGNATRCAARFCVEMISTNKKTMRFKTGAGLVTAEVLDNNLIRVQMPEARFISEKISLQLSNEASELFALVNTGVPHLVKEITKIENAFDQKLIAQQCRAHIDLHPHGANVTFYAKTEHGIDAVTYERGVEDFTLACGTGAVAAALVYLAKDEKKQVVVRMPGGNLDIQFIDGSIKPYMSGEALFVGEFYYNLEVIR